MSVSPSCPYPLRPYPLIYIEPVDREMAGNEEDLEEKTGAGVGSSRRVATRAAPTPVSYLTFVHRQSVHQTHETDT